MARTEVVKIADIDRSGRHRKQLGELRTLCQSIEKVGLLQPIVLDCDKKLVAGARRIAAFERLGRTSIDATIVDNLDDAELLLQAERDENTCRLDFTESEKVALGKALEKIEREAAKKRKAQKPGGKQGEKVSPEKFTEEKGTTRDKIGKAIGMSGPIYQRAKAVVDAAESDPETFGVIAEEMDRTGKVTPAYNKVIEIKKNGTRTKQEESPSSGGRTPVGVVRANEAINCLKRIPKNDLHRKRGFQIVADFIRHNR